MLDLTRLALRAAVAIAILALLVPAPASTQTLYGSIVGTVTDAQGAAIPGATVSATNAVVRASSASPVGASSIV